MSNFTTISESGTKARGQKARIWVPWMRTCEGNTRIFGGLQVTELFLQHWQNTEPRDVSSHCVLLNASESTVSIILWHSPSAAALQTPSSPGLPAPTSIFNYTGATPLLGRRSSLKFTGRSLFDVFNFLSRLSGRQHGGKSVQLQGGMKKKTWQKKINATI